MRPKPQVVVQESIPSAQCHVRERKKQKRYSLNSQKFLSEKEYAHLRGLVFKKTTRSAVILKIGMYTGARAQEILNIKKNDFNSAEKTILIRGLKGSNDREIPIPNRIFGQLYRYSLNQKSERIFPFTYTILNRVWLRYRPCNKSFHSLRHTFAMRIFSSTKDIKLVQTALGHRSINNTMIYVDFVYSRRELKRLLTIRH